MDSLYSDAFSQMLQAVYNWLSTVAILTSLSNVLIWTSRAETEIMSGL